MRFAIGPTTSNANVQAVHTLSAAGLALDGVLEVNGESLLLGSMAVGGDVVATGAFASAVSPTVGKVTLNAIRGPIDTGVTEFQSAKKGGNTASTAYLAKFYAAHAVGNANTVRTVAFSLRDDDEQKQYNTVQFSLVESRWQMLARLGGQAAVPWNEPAVSYQGRELMPYPGRKKWAQEATMLRVDKPRLFDTQRNVAKDRGTVYEDTIFPATSKVTPATGFGAVS
jgi:hypothetical protein